MNGELGVLLSPWEKPASGYNKPIGYFSRFCGLSRSSDPIPNQNNRLRTVDRGTGGERQPWLDRQGVR